MGYSVPEHFAALARLGPDHPSPQVLRAGRGQARRSGRRLPTRSSPIVASLARLLYPCAGPSLACDGSPQSRANALRLPDRRIPARAPGGGVLDRGADASRAVDADAGAVLQRAAGRGAAAARHRPRIPCSAAISGRRSRSGSARSPSGSPAPSASMLLAQACIVVTYWAVFTLGRAIVGTRHAVLGRAADGRHRRLHGAERRIRPGRAGGAALGAGAAALLARGRRGQARRLVPAGARSRPAAAGELCRADPGRAADRCSRW